MPEDTLFHALKEYIHPRDIIHHNDKLILAISGGLDSVALLDLFSRLGKSWNLTLVVAHLNHELRSIESDQHCRTLTHFSLRDRRAAIIEAR